MVVSLAREGGEVGEGVRGIIGFLNRRRGV